MTSERRQKYAGDAHVPPGLLRPVLQHQQRPRPRERDDQQAGQHGEHPAGRGPTTGRQGFRRRCVSSGRSGGRH